MNFSYNIPAALIGAAVVLVQPQLAVALTGAQVSDAAKEFTVLIGGEGAGSGVIFERKGETYFVLTNRHVVSKDGRYEVQTPDGVRHPVYRSQEVPGLDLAVLQFTSSKNYRIAKLGNSDQIREGMTVYVAGWADTPGSNKRSYQFTEGSIRSRRQNPDDGYGLVYSNEAIPGMSGGPVLDENGRVVGINGRADTEVRKDGALVAVLRLGIPINTFLSARGNSRPITGTPTTGQKPSPRPNIATAGQSNPRETPTATRQRNTEQVLSEGRDRAIIKNYKVAIAQYNKTLQINPNNPDIYLQRGYAYRELRNYQAALKDYNEGLRLSPNNKEAYIQRGYVQLQLKDYKGALADGNQAIRLADADDSYNKSIQNKGYVLQGLAYQMQKDYQGALTAYEKALALLAGFSQAEGLSLPAVNRIGLVKYELGNLEEAMRRFQAVINIDNKLAEPQLALATILYTKGEHERGLEMAQAALRLDKSLADIKVLKENFWGDRIIADAQKLLQSPKIRSLTPPSSRSK